MPHSPWNIPNSQTSLLASRASEDFVDKRENLRPVDLIVRLDNTTILHKLNCTMQSLCPKTNTVLGGYKNLNIHLGRKPDKSRLPTPFDIMIEMKGSEETQNKTRIVSLDSDKNGNSLSACVTHSPWNISNSQTRLLASRASEDVVGVRENLETVDLMVRTNNTTIIYKLKYTVKSSCPDTNTVLGG